MDYKVIYSDRKSIGIKIENGGITVKAPRGVSSSYIDKVVIAHKDWIERTLVREKRKAELEGVDDPEKIKALKNSAKVYFAERCRYYADIMSVTYGTVKITSAKTRYGSCSSKGNICFSYRLMLYPEAAREYVVVHELAHRTEMNHSRRFYAIVEKYMPDYQQRRKILKDKDRVE